MPYKNNDLMIDDTMYAPGGLLDHFVAMSPEEKEVFLATLEEEERKDGVV